MCPVLFESTVPTAKRSEVITAHTELQSALQATQRPTVVLPEPDSPTRPSVWLASTENDTPDTAWTTAFSTRTPFAFRT
jgi:hypothetical protein